MFIIEKQENNRFKVQCRFTDPYTNSTQFLYHVLDLNLEDVACFVLDRNKDQADYTAIGDEDSADYISSIFRLTNIKRVYVGDTGRVSAVSPQ